MSEELLNLAERCERAVGFALELDEAIFRALGWTPIANPTSAGGLVGRWTRNGVTTGHGGPPRYTASNDAAISLVPDGCLFTLRTLWDGPIVAGYSVVSTYGNDAEECDGKRHLDDYTGIAATPALALCAAVLKARASTEPIP